MVTKSLCFSLSLIPLSLSLSLSFPSFYISVHCYVFTLFPLISVYLWSLLLPTTFPLNPFILISTGLLFVAFKFTKTGTPLASPIQCTAVLLSKVLILGHFKAGHQCICVLDACSHTERGGFAQSKSTITKQLCSKASQSHEQRHGGRKEVCWKDKWLDHVEKSVRSI